MDQQILIKGFLRLYLLHHLEAMEACGAEIAEHIAVTNRGHWKPSPGSLYPLLNKLEAEDLIVGMWDTTTKPPCKRYRITGLGRQELTRQRASMRPQMESAVKMLQNHIRVIWGNDR